MAEQPNFNTLIQGFFFIRMKHLLLFIGLLLGSCFAGNAVPRVRIQLQVEPTTHRFTCRYTFRLPASDTATAVRLNLSREFRIRDVQSRGGPHRVGRVYYAFLADTMQQVQVRFPRQNRKARQLTLVYTGTLGKRLATEQVMVFSGHSMWLPFRPYQDYELLDYELNVRVPASYQVLSTTPAVRQAQGQWLFRGNTSAIEVTALVGKQFRQATTGAAPVTVFKPGTALTNQDTTILQKAQAIVAFYNRGIGRQDPITRFSVFLPGTNADAFALLDNATVITYSDFDVANRRDLLVLAHEISHKWWGYGSVHDENDWLNEAFATYSSVLYLQAAGDITGFREELARLAKTAVGTPPLLGFDRNKHEPPMYRRVIYGKGTGILHALHARLGTDKFLSLMAATAARKVSTTPGFLEVVEQAAGTDTRAWLLAELNR